MLRPEFTSAHLTLPKCCGRAQKLLYSSGFPNERALKGPLSRMSPTGTHALHDRVRSDVELLLSGQLASGIPVAVKRTSPMSLERFAVAAGAIERVPPKLMHQLLDAITEPLYENRTKAKKGLRSQSAATRTLSKLSLLSSYEYMTSFYWITYWQLTRLIRISLS